MHKTTLKRVYIFGWVSVSFFVFIEIIGLYIIITQWNMIINAENDIMGYMTVATISTFAIFFLAIQIKEIILLCRDYKYLRKKSYTCIVGTVLSFTKNINPETGTQSNTRPVIKVIPSGEEVTLHINDYVQIGDTYKIIYLPNTKLAAILEKVE